MLCLAEVDAHLSVLGFCFITKSCHNTQKSEEYFLYTFFYCLWVHNNLKTAYNIVVLIFKFWGISRLLSIVRVIVNTAPIVLISLLYIFCILQNLYSPYSHQCLLSIIILIVENSTIVRWYLTVFLIIFSRRLSSPTISQLHVTSSVHICWQSCIVCLCYFTNKKWSKSRFV